MVEFPAGTHPYQRTPIHVFTKYLKAPLSQPAATLKQVASHPFYKHLLTQPLLAVDVETTGLDPVKDDLVCITLASPEGAAIFHPSQQEALIPLLCTTREFLIQHAPFDCGFLLSKLHIKLYPRAIYDTRLEEQLYLTRVNQARSASLREQLAHYLGIYLDKSPATTFRGDDPLNREQIIYTALDAQLLFPLAHQHLLTHRAITGEQVSAMQAMNNYIAGTGPLPERT